MNKHWREVSTFNRLLLWVEDSHRRALSGLAPPAERLRNLTDDSLKKQGLRQVNERELKTMLPETGRPTTNFLEKNCFVMLKQIDGGVRIQPAMTVSADFSLLDAKPKFKPRPPLPHVRIRVALGFMADERLRLAGYRFETPEGIHGTRQGVGSGIHDFFHAQPIVAFEKHREPLDPSAIHGAYPVKQPSFPLAAECLVTFVLSIFVTLYGRDFLNDVSAESMVSPKLLRLLDTHAYPRVGCCLSEK